MWRCFGVKWSALPQIDAASTFDRQGRMAFVFSIERSYRAELVGTLANLLTPANRRGTIEGEILVAAGRFGVIPLTRRRWV